MSECADTPHDKLIAEICDSRVAKTEREHAAGREIERLRAELIAYQKDVEGAERRTLAFAHACVRDVEGITVGGALEAQRDEIAKLRAERDALAHALRETIEIAEGAMRAANRDGAEYTDDYLDFAKAALAKLEGKQ